MNNSKIEWTDHTFNPWWGCMKVSAGCKNCYAETLDNRWKGGHWGPGSTRRPMGEQYWKHPLKWNKAAAAAGVPAKVFCASMADVFEGHDDTLIPLVRLYEVIDNTPWLIWQLLTKRPENIPGLMPSSWKRNGIPKNVWIGTSVENQEAADTRIPHLLKVPATVRFLSCEPLLGPITLFYNEESALRGPAVILSGGVTVGTADYPPEGYDDSYPGIDWVIAGGESGHGARPMHPDWVRSLRDQCAMADVSFFFKQWGEYLPFCQLGPDPYKAVHPGWPVKSFPSPHNMEKVNQYFKAGKGAAGRLLDGVEHNAFPV